MNIRYKSLTIRDATSADSVQLAAWWNSGRIMAHAGFPNGLKTTAEKIASDISNSTGCHRLILEQYGKPIGEASYRTVPAEADELFAAAEENAKWRYNGYVRLSKMEF